MLHDACYLNATPALNQNSHFCNLWWAISPIVAWSNLNYSARYGLTLQVLIQLPPPNHAVRRLQKRKFASLFAVRLRRFILN